MADIELAGVTKRFRDGTEAVNDLDLRIDDGELMVLVGPSGSGKSTILRLVAGLETPSAGSIRIGGRSADDQSPGDRDVAMVFQDYALYPHMSAYRNMAFALESQRLGRLEADRRVREAAALLGIGHLLDRKPAQLSGGERQRVAMGRAIVRRPVAFLMDEPLSNLDARLRIQLRSEIRHLHRQLGSTFLYVTHDQVEAMTMGDRVAVLRSGRLQQVATASALYDAPANAFVAAFIGSPPASLLCGSVHRQGGRPVLTVGPWQAPLAAGWPGPDGKVIVAIRPEHLVPAPDASRVSDRSVAELVVDEVEPIGATIDCHLLVDAEPADQMGGLPAPRPVDYARPTLSRPMVVRLVARMDRRAAVRAADRLRIRLDVDRVLLFDPTEGGAIGPQPPDGTSPSAATTTTPEG